MSTPRGPESRNRLTDAEPPVRPDTSQKTAGDAFRDVPGVDVAEPVPAGEPPADLEEDNPTAARVVGKRADDYDSPPVPINIPAEEGYHCPLCMYLHEGPEGENGEPGELDERLQWSEYRTFIWCSECERDYPSALCTPDIEESTRIYLASVEHLTELAAARARRQVLEEITVDVLAEAMVEPSQPVRGATRNLAERTHTALTERLGEQA